MENFLMEALKLALEIKIESLSFEDNLYVDEAFFLESIQNNFAGWYKEDTLTLQVDFILTHCQFQAPEDQAPGRILDLACGHGRHAHLFAQKGYEVVGTDISPALITYLNKSYGGANLVFEQRSFSEIDDEELFHLVIVLGNSLSLIPRNDLPSVLGKLRASLKPSGKLFLEMDNRAYFVQQEAGKRNWSFNAGRWLQFSEHFYDPIDKLEKTVDTSLDLQSKTVKQYRLTKSLYDKIELTGICTKNGLNVLHTFGGWDGSEVSDESRSLLLVAEK